MASYAGGCTCGAIRYEITAEPVRSFQCQCRDCQRDTGGGHASVIVFPRAAMQITGDVAENPRTADSGAATQNVPDMIGVYVGTLDDPSGFAPEIVMFASRGHRWDHLDPALPKVPLKRPSA